MHRAGTPLVGRTREVARVRRLVREAAEGAGGTAVIVGEPGSGKTRLVEVAVRSAAAAGAAVRVGQAVHQEVERTLGAALDAFGLRLDELLGPAAADRVVLEAGATAAAGFLLADRLLEVVEARCARGPLLLAVEDLHWCDTTTLTWLRAVAERAPSLPLAVLLTTRPPAAGSRLRRALDVLGAAEVELGPLAADEVVALARLVRGRPPDAPLVRILDTARGNPLLVLALLGDGDDPGRAPAARLAELDAAQLAAVQTAAVLGTRVVPAELAAVSGARPADVLAHLEAAAAAGVLVPQDDRFAFRHELYRSAALATLSGAARAVLHLEAARSLAAAGAPAVEVAEHVARGARPGDAEAVRWLQAAALDIVGAAPAGALRLVDVALGLARPAPPDSLVLLRVRALAGTGRTGEAELLGRALLHSGPDPATEAVLRRELAFTALVEGRAADCVTEMERCAVLAPTPAARARVHGELAFARFMALDHRGAATAAGRAVQDGLNHGDLTAQVAGESVLCFLDLFANRTPQAVRRAREIVGCAELAGAADAHAFQPWFIACLVWLETDDLDRLARSARRGREVAVERGAGWAVPGYDAVSAFGALRAGALDDAAATAEATLGYLDGVDGLGVAVWCHAFLAQVLLHRDEVDLAEQHIRTAEQWMTRSRAQLGFEQVQLARAALQERSGEPDAALATLALTWDLYDSVGALSPLPAIGLPLARLARTAGDRSRLVATADALAAAARATGTSGVRVIAEVAAAWRDADPDRALAAASRALTTPRPALVATALGDAAVLLSAAGRNAAADRAALDAAARWSALGAYADADACTALARSGRRTPRRPRFGMPALTATERRVTALVADGLSNSQIAAALGVSRRTVESHVSSVYRKLEVTSRVALARAALGHDIR
jgi:DNA-binding NarL/FixJ family response regulator